MKIILFSVLMSLFNWCVETIKNPSQNLKSPDIHHSPIEKSDAKLQYRHACSYLQGEKSKSNEAEAFRWMKESASKGYVPALLDLGFFYEYGIGTEIDFKQALDSYQKAVDLGSNKAQQRINILKIPLCMDSIESKLSSFEITPEYELYYIHLLIGAYELYIEDIEEGGAFYSDNINYSQYQARYFLSHENLPQAYQEYIAEWRKVADRMLKLINRVPDSEFEATWEKGLASIANFEAKHPEISSVISFEQAKKYINRKYKLDIHIKNHTKVSKALRNHYNYVDSKISLFNSLVRKLNQISQKISIH